MRFINRKSIALTGAAAALVAVSAASTAVAGNLIDSHDIKNGSIRIADMTPKAVSKMKGQTRATGATGARVCSRARPAQPEHQGVKGDTGKAGADGKDGVDADMSVIDALEDRIAALEAGSTNGNDVNTNWYNGQGATIVDANTVMLDSRNADGVAYASIKNLDLNVRKGTTIEFTYRLADGAAVGWGAPRIQIRINGTTYSSAHINNPDYGHDNGDGTFTVSVKATSMLDNNATENPDGTIAGASLVYDHVPAKGTVTFTNVVISGQPISFK